MAFSSNSSGGPMADINVTPLVDVMLVLLIIFMITAPLMAHKVKVELPTASLDKKPEILVPPVTIAISSNGDVYWNDQPMGSVSDPQNLKNRLEVNLATNLAKEPQPQVDIRADEDTKYEKIKAVVTIVREAGMRKVGFVSMPERN
ncbi:biopolymer transporter ExbD [Arenimonas sp. GDDSR-1]|uniref:ExbD/TolR family protein n=1 Tax=Arenimonas sp. GDDSR-1 TaxID=2950125 RepID=UPI0026351BDF|nr:biopolymer transporter ExbD [Arenimonas sp. GDDSR-1]